MQPPVSLNVRRAEFGKLDCTVVSSASSINPPKHCVVFCHGFGAPGTDLVPLGNELAALLGDSEPYFYVFPEGPLDLAAQGMSGARAWWMVDIERYQRAMSRPEELARLAKQIPVGLREASALLQNLLMDVQRQTGIPLQRTVLGGFSQGSMIATDAALRLPEPPAALCILSGSILAEEEWRPLANKRGPLPVLQSHGYFDPILPFRAAQMLRDLLTEAGLAVDFLPFDGPHTIPFEALERTAALMRRLAANPQ
jgi:phospholipase/carboxylesterase